jgi:hypothetical protein
MNEYFERNLSLNDETMRLMKKELESFGSLKSIQYDWW